MDILKQPKVALIDIDSMFYVFAATDKDIARCKNNIKAFISRTIDKTSASEGYVFMKGSSNFRTEAVPDYKGHRKNSVPEATRNMVHELEEFTKEFALTADGCEADDLCGIYSNVCLKEGKLPIICHIDKDLNQIPGLHYNYRHKHEHKYKVSCEDAYHMMLRQCLSGDRTDNIKGIPGIGEVKGNAILEGLDHKDYLDKVLATWQEKVEDDWETKFIQCANGIIIRSDDSNLKTLTLDEIKELLTWEGPKQCYPKTLYNYT